MASLAAAGKGECHSVQISWVKFAVLTFLPCKKREINWTVESYIYIYMGVFLCVVVLVMWQVDAEDCPFIN